MNVSSGEGVDGYTGYYNGSVEGRMVLDGTLRGEVEFEVLSTPLPCSYIFKWNCHKQILYTFFSFVKLG